MNACTNVFGVMGSPVSHSLSPFMHNYAFKLMSLDAVYTAFNATNAKEAVDGVRGLGLKGLSVTIPFKKSVMEYLDNISDSAKKIGAVNTITNKDGVLTGDNTDWKGFVRSLRENTDVRDKKVLVIGAGGAARAVCYGIVKEGGELFITNRTVEKGKDLARDFGGKFIERNDLKNLSPEIIINTTSVGMLPDVDKSPVEEDVFQNKGVAFDIVYNPVETKFLRMAKKKGFKTVSGIGMFVYQGEEQFFNWTGKKFPSQHIKEEIFKKLF